MGSLVAIVGGTGFIGRALVARLLTDGWSVRIVARHEVPSVHATDDAERIYGDITEPAFAERALRGAQCIVNLAGATSCEDERAFYALHRDAPARIAMIARRENVRCFVHLSAMGVRIDAPSVADRSKAEGELAVTTLFPDAEIVRPSLVYGCGDHFFGRFFPMVSRSRFIPLLGGGRTRFEPMHIADVVEALLGILRSQEKGGHVYAFGGPDVLTFRMLIERLCDALHRHPKLISVPFPIAVAIAELLERVGDPPITSDQVRLLKTDKVREGNERDPASLGVRPRSLEAFFSRMSSTRLLP